MLDSNNKCFHQKSYAPEISSTKSGVPNMKKNLEHASELLTHKISFRTRLIFALVVQ